MTKGEQIVALLKKRPGLAPAEIAELVGTTPEYVSSIRYKWKRDGDDWLVVQRQVLRQAVQKYRATPEGREASREANRKYKASRNRLEGLDVSRIKPLKEAVG